MLVGLGWWLVDGGWWFVVGVWWVVGGGWWFVAGGWCPFPPSPQSPPSPHFPPFPNFPTPFKIWDWLATSSMNVYDWSAAGLISMQAVWMIRGRERAPMPRQRSAWSWASSRCRPLPVQHRSARSMERSASGCIVLLRLMLHALNSDMHTAFVALRVPATKKYIHT